MALSIGISNTYQNLQLNVEKIELHSHLEGTISAETLLVLAGDGRKKLLPTTDENELNEALAMPGYEGFRNYFKVTKPFRTTLEDIHRLTTIELERAANNNVIYAEYRFNPLGPAKLGTDPWQILPLRYDSTDARPGGACTITNR